jgi:lysine N6-hydroxylase
MEGTSMSEPTDPQVLDAIGVGIGPFNLGLAALADSAPDLRIKLFDERPRFSWHATARVPGALLQAGFLADLVTLVDPTSRWSFLSYLCAHDRMYPFYLAERFRLPPHEYEDYCRWVAESLPRCHFGTRVDSVSWDEAREAFAVRVARTADAVHHGDTSLFGDGVRATVYAHNLVLGVGTSPMVPLALRHTVGPDVFHSAEYGERLPDLSGRRHVTVVGSGQSGAEIFLDLLRQQSARGWALSWLTRSPAFAPLEASALAAEHLTPEYVRYFHELPDHTRKSLLASQWRLHQAVEPSTLDAIFHELYEHLMDGRRAPVTLQPGVRVDSVYPSATNGLTVSGVHTIEDTPFRVETEAVVLATGYAARRPPCLEPLAPLINWDDRGRFIADLGYRAQTSTTITGGLFVQNAELHSHGVATPSLSIGAYRSATILNQIAGRELFTLPKRTAFTTFGQA